MKNQRGDAVIAVIVVFCLLVFIGLPVLFSAYYAKGTQRVVPLTITSKERVEDSGGAGSKYLLFTDSGTYENTDSIWNGKFRSSDIYGALVPGKKYACLVYGWRLPFSSQYPNIIRCEQVE